MTAFQHAPLFDRMQTLPPYASSASEFAFLLGGIGTGNVSVGARGQLKDWELFNHPDKGRKFPYTFFAIHTECAGKSDTRMLESALRPPYTASHGFNSADMGGLPRLEDCEIRAQYPLCAVDFKDKTLPVHVTLEAYTPFIPLNAKDSGLPGAIIRYRVKNPQDMPVFVSVAGTLCNMTTAMGTGWFEYVNYHGKSQNTAYSEDGLNGVYMESLDFPDWHPMHASLSLATTNESFSVKPNFFMGAWWDGIQDFWDDFSADGKLEFASLDGGITDTEILKLDSQHIGALAAHRTLQAGEEYVFEFLLTWHFPNRKKWWFEGYDPKTIREEETIRNHYAIDFDSARAVAAYLAKEMARLEQQTLLFHDTFFASTLPVPLLDAASANIAIVRSPTCFWLENGLFMGWEGCFDHFGCCSGNCTHVWNYEQTLAFLFPELEQTMRQTEFLYETAPDGRMNFRAHTMLEGKPFEMHPAADGQLGTVVRLLREYKLSGKRELIDEMGEIALRVLDYAAVKWDRDGDGVLDSQQHNTYDIEFYGVNSMINTMYIAALRAGAQIARLLYQPERAVKYEALAQQSAAKMDALLWNGEYYEQKIDDLNACKYQYGKGVLSDQLLGQYAAYMAGLGAILPEEHVKQALLSVYKYNLRHDFTHHAHVQRTYAVDEETGLLLCSWPKGGRPRFPFVYSDEVWSGVEYQVAVSLLYAGLPNEAVEIVRGVRDRYNGTNRAPFDEVECGHHYARSLASWGLIPAASGFTCAPDGSVAFSPRVNEKDFTCFYSTAHEWGVLRQMIGENGAITQEVIPLYKA